MGGSPRAFEPCITHVEQLHLKVCCLVFDIRFADLAHYLSESLIERGASNRALQILICTSISRGHVGLHPGRGHRLGIIDRQFFVT